MKLRVLILEDRISDLELIVHELRQAGYDPDYAHVSTEADYRAKVSDGWDIILADYSLPQFNALAALQIKREAVPRVPFIVVTGSISEEAAVTCMREGAVDYLLKDRLARLGPALYQALQAKRAQDEKYQAEEQIRHSNRELTLLNHIIAASSESVSEAAFLQVACRELQEALEVAQVSAVLSDEEGTAAVVVAESFAPGAPSIMNARLPLWDLGAAGIVLKRNVPLVIEDLAGFPLLAPYADLIRDSGIKGLMIIPLFIGDQLTGSIALSAMAPRHFTEQRVALAQSVAGQISGSLERMRLERERGLLIAAIEQTMDGILVADLRGRIFYANHGFEVMSGYTRGEIIGRSVESLAGPDVDRQVLVAMMGGLGADHQWRGRAVWRKKDGTPYHIEASVIASMDADGKPLSYVSVQRDVTDRLAMESRYLQAQKMEAVGRLAGGVAHDFNNILTALLAYADLLVEQIPAEDEALENLEEIRKAGGRAASLTRQLLIFSRRQVAEPRVVNLTALLRDFEKMLRRLIGEDIRVTSSFLAEDCMVFADPGQLEQVAMNLAVNARDAMSQGGELRFRIEDLVLDEAAVRDQPEGKPGRYVLFTVSDTGIGMSPETLSHAFEPFFTTKAEGKGTGLGLATVYGIVKQAGGWIRVTSAPGAGTAFSIYMPRYEGTSGVAQGPASREALPRGTESVFVVDDDDTVRKLIVKILTGLGYSVTAFLNAKEALQGVAALEHGPDMLLTDIVLPGMDGRILAGMVSDARPGIAVLSISGYDNRSVPGEQKASDAHFLRKPFTPAQLARAVRDALDS
jgi:PAS domain S-box-containing protein